MNEPICRRFTAGLSAARTALRREVAAFAGSEIPDEEMNALKTSGTVTRHQFHGELNYTLHPVRDPDILDRRRPGSASYRQSPSGCPFRQ